MALSAEIKDWYIKTIPGMNNKVEDLDLKTKWVENAQNCRFQDDPGSVDKRDPVSAMNSSALDAKPVVSVYRYYTSTGLSSWVSVCGTSAYHVTDAGVKTAIRTGLTDGKRCSFVTYKNLLIGSSGYDDMWVWDGNTSDNVTWELGACKAVLGTAGGNLDATATYSYRVTFDADAVVNGATSNTITTAASRKVELSNIPLGPSGTTNRKIYRTVGGGGSYLLLATIADNTTTTYSDNIADGSLGAAYPSVTDDMPKGSIIQVHRERFFVSGDPSNPNYIYYGNPYLPHYIQQTTNLDFLDVSPQDGDEIMGLPIQLGVMVCVKKNSIRKLHVTAPTSGANPAAWYADDPVAWIGSPAQWSITQTPNGVAFLGWDHWYMFDGASAQPIFDEFDTKEILEANYTDVVGFFHDENFYAAYTDKEFGNQTHDRLMVYNLKREALSIDLWTSSTLTGPNCFAARDGNDELNDLFFGDSADGYLVKERDSNSDYKLRTKTECNAGTLSNTWVGGTENAPYIELGASSVADKIPDDIVIFWDNESTTPGSGWTEITGNENKLIKIDATAGTAGAGTSHLHALTGSIEMWFGTHTNLGDGSPNAVAAHSHEISANAVASTPYPRNITYRMFKKNNTTTEYEFPTGAIVMWDQETAPTGWLLITEGVGYYPMQGTSDLSALNSSTHSHTFSIPTGTAAGNLAQSDSGTNGPRYGHNHTVTGALSTETMDTWEVAYVAFAFIKKVGESDTWDGSTKYCYALFASATAASLGWSDVTSSYSSNPYLKIGTGAPDTGDAANASHNHTAGTFTTSTESATWGNDGYHATGYEAPHTHQVILSSGETDVGAPPSITFRLFRKILGKMTDFNEGAADGGTVSYTTGTWTSPVIETNSESLLKLYWNETLAGSDDITIQTRAGFYLDAAGTAPSDTDGGASITYETAVTDSNGSEITQVNNTTSPKYIQYKINFSATDSLVTNPRIYFTNGYVARFTYHEGVTLAETSVNYIYDIGFRNFDAPMMDKIFKKIATTHVGDTGSFTLTWTTENATGSFIIPLDTFPTQWNSYFASTAFGKEAKFTISKNDLEQFRLSEIKGLYSPLRPIV